MSTMLLFLMGSFVLGIVLRDKPTRTRQLVIIAMALYMTYAYFAGGAQF